MATAALPPVEESGPPRQSPIASTTDHDIPDGGYGWMQVAVVFSINAFTWGQTAVGKPRIQSHHF